jgi:uncharacterized membrane protein
MKQKITYFIILGLSFCWCGMILYAPYLKSINSAFNVLIYFCFSRICHQIPERSFYIFGQKFAVCERCTAIYFAFLSGVLLYPLIKKIKRQFLVYALQFATLIIVIEFLFGYIKVFQNVYTILISGALFGFCAAYFITSGLIESIASIKPFGGNKIGR